MTDSKLILLAKDLIEVEQHDGHAGEAYSRDDAHPHVRVYDFGPDSLTICLPADENERNDIVARLVTALLSTIEPVNPFARDVNPEKVLTDAGWHGRVRGANGEPVWTTEVLESSANVSNAFAVLAAAAHVGVIAVDERTGR